MNDSITNVQVCQHCGRLIADGDETFTVIVGYGLTKEWCADCVEDDASICDHCGELYASDERTDVHTTSRRWTDAYCPNCAEDHTTQCDECGECWDNDHIAEYSVYGQGYENVCDDCRDDFYYCENCDDLVSSDDVVEVDGSYYCPDCASQHTVIQGYGHTYASNFYHLDSEPDTGLYLGVELETECDGNPNVAAGALMRFIGYDRQEVKHDSSLTDGFEIATQPMTPRYHIESGYWRDVVKVLRDYNCGSHDPGTCGLHIHISRDYFDNQSQICTLDRILQTHSAEWIRFSRREGYSADRWCKIETDGDLGIKTGDPDYVKREKWIVRKERGNRYKALNLCNSSTIEVRLWRGTLKLQTLLATIEATAGLAILAKESRKPYEYEHMPWGCVCSRIARALDAHGIDSKAFKAYLLERGL